MKEIDENKTKYFVFAILLLIILGVILIIHFNNKSLVSGDKDSEVTTKKTTEKVTTEVVTTTKKVANKTDEVSVNENIYKSVIDDNNRLVYNYKLTDEISDSDKIISTILTVSDELKASNVIGLYDISLYDVNMTKKSVKNSFINISIPITGDLIGYDEYKVIYLDDNDNISNENFETNVSDGYIKFSTTHLSKFGIIGLKNNNIVQLNNDIVDFKKVSVSVLNNNEKVNESDILYFTNDNLVTLTVDGIENYELYYGLRSKDSKEVEFVKYIDDVRFDGVTPYDEVKIIARVVVGDEYYDYELNTVKVYDIIYEYDRNNPEVMEDTSEEEQNILLKDVTVDEEVIDSEDVTDENKTTIYVNGNIYLVDKADISELGMTGTLYIDTSLRIDLGTITEEERELIDTKQLDSIVIMSEQFNLNGVNYTYEVKDDGSLVIYRLSDSEDNSEEAQEKEELTDEEFANKFNGDFKVSSDKDKNLVITRVEELEEEKITDEVEEVTNED